MVLKVGIALACVLGFDGLFVGTAIDLSLFATAIVAAWVFVQFFEVFPGQESMGWTACRVSRKGRMK